jgi:beta-glucosidase
MNFKYPFLDPGLPLKKRIQDLISRLSVEEKAGFIPTRNQAVERLGIPAWSIGAEAAHGFVDREGNNTTFPQTIGLASGWDRELLRKIGEIGAIEARVYYKTHDRKGGLAIWSPTVDLERDPRWGRTEEGYGEDPFLTSELSSSYIHGAQGDDPFYLRVSCGPKHFFANNNERDRANCCCSIPPRCLHEYYLAPFKAAIQKAKAVSLMTAYNEVNGIPMMLHPMLEETVKNQWGLEGHIVTDGNDFLQTVDSHHYFDTHAETLAAALKNGNDNMNDEPAEVIPAVMDALKRKLLDEEELDKHLERIFAIRFRLGQFDPPGLCPYDSIGEADLMKNEYRDVAREAVRKSAVLLKNEGNILPLRPDAVKGSIAVLGPLADALHLDWYSGIPTKMSTPLDGLRELYGKDKVVYTDCRDIVSFTTEDNRPLVLDGKVLSAGRPGDKPARFYMEDWGWGARTFTDIESGLMLETPYYRPEPGTEADKSQLVVNAAAKSSFIWFNKILINTIPQGDGLFLLRIYDNRRIAYPDGPGPLELHDDTFDRPGELFRMKLEKDGLAAAEKAAREAAQVIIIAGNDPMINGREGVDRPSLNLPPRQEELISRVLGVNPKTVLVLLSGYPFTCKDITERVPAILWMAHGIQETGGGLADILGGVYSPAGRLPLTWYEDEKQLPPMMEYDIISAGSTYRYFTGKALFPFGHGLSYSNFTYSRLVIDKSAAGENEIVNVSFNLKNTGSVEADEVPQMYVTPSTEGAACSTRGPLKSLKGFTRLSLKPGEENTVRFTLPVCELAVWDSFHARFRVEAGRCQVMIGGSSTDIRLSGGFDLHGENIIPRELSGPVYAERFDDYADCFLHEKRGSAVPAVFNKNDGGWIRFAALDFAEGRGIFSVVAQGEPGSRIEIRLDAPDGALAGTIAVPNTGDISFYPLVGPYSPRRRPVWAYAETVTEKICGIRDLYLVLYGKTGLWQLDIR